MKGKISSGIWFIFLGLVALLHNFDVINFNFWAIIQYWPLIIISIGANLIFQHKKNGILILTILNVILCLFLGYVGLTSQERFRFTDHININSSNDTTGTSPIVETPFTENIDKATLELNAGAASIQLDSNETVSLVQASSSNGNVGLKLNKTGAKDNPVVEITTVIKTDNENKNKVNLSINKKPLWDLNLNLGAASFKADLSQHRFSKLEINAGAASCKLDLGMPATAESLIEINTAASACEINIPKDAACRLEMETLLSSKKLDGFNKKEDFQETDNYATADKKYFIKVTGAANSLKINRY